MAFQASRARAHLEEGLGLLETLDSRSAAVRLDLRGPLPRDARPDRVARLRRLRRLLRLSPLAKLRIVGAGLLR
jgi:hypothetical protein